MGPASAGAPRVVSSNVVRADYAGSDACLGCHEGIYRRWERSPMHRMTRVPDTTDVRAPFEPAWYPLVLEGAFAIADRLSQREGEWKKFDRRGLRVRQFLLTSVGLIEIRSPKTL